MHKRLIHYLPQLDISLTLQLPLGEAPLKLPGPLDSSLPPPHNYLPRGPSTTFLSLNLLRGQIEKQNFGPAGKKK